jgi:hypothetical protein
MSLLTFILVSSIISTAAFAIGERVAIGRRKIRRQLIIMGLTARLAERDEIARNNWN